MRIKFFLVSLLLGIMATAWANEAPKAHLDSAITDGKEGLNKCEYTYNEDGDVTFEVYYTKNLKMWVKNSKNVYSYNELRQVASIEDFQWNNSTNDWQASERHDYTYEDHGYQIERTDWTMEGNCTFAVSNLEDDPEFLSDLQTMLLASGAAALLPIYLIRNI